jgi:hypothetical protein
MSGHARIRDLLPLHSEPGSACQVLTAEEAYVGIEVEGEINA